MKDIPLHPVCSHALALLLAVSAIPWTARSATNTPAVSRQFGIDHAFALQDLPPSRLREQLSRVSEPARHRAIESLHRFSFPEADAHSLAVDPQGGVLYICEFEAVHEPAADKAPEESVPSGTTVPVNPFPEHLEFNSRPGAPNTLFLDFTGTIVTDTAWNDYISRDPIPARAFSTDSDANTFSDAEQAAIKRIWQRVAEDYAPFDVNVTTVEPVVWNIRTAHVIITRSTDVNGLPNPADFAGGVAYVNVFGRSDYEYYRPAWVYHDNLANQEDYISEAAAHEAGHNLGLSHDGRTDGYEYYGGHGTGLISWGPIMGTGYNRNVSQWSKGEYYLANNTQDDLAILAAKMGYRPDDYGHTYVSASALVVTNHTRLLSTDAETDPDNRHPSNKGVIHHSSDVDMWVFPSGAGDIQLAVRPWESPAHSGGGNLDVRMTLIDAIGNPVAGADPASGTDASLQASVQPGVYYLKVEPVGAGSPLVRNPTGYTSYGSLGQYFITGTVVDATGVVFPPIAELVAEDAVDAGATSHTFQVVYHDNVAIETSTIGNGDTYVTGPGGYSNTAMFISLDVPTNGSPRTATYRIPAPGGSWQLNHNGDYNVWMNHGAVSDTEGASVPPGRIGVFRAMLANLLYSANMNANPTGWTYGSGWQHGKAGGVLGIGVPKVAASGTNIIGYNLDFGYKNYFLPVYATTPAISCTNSDLVLLRFQRWLGVNRNDTAAIEVSTNNTTWTVVWSASDLVQDSAWQSVQYDISGIAARKANVRLRWVMAGNLPHDVNCGWRIDDVEVLGVTAVFDITPPSAALFAQDVAQAGGDVYEFSVTYTDGESGVDVSTFSSGDLQVVGVGTNGYTNLAVHAGSDNDADGSPRTAFYRVTPPGGSWSEDDNGVYQVTLRDAAVMDVAGNATTGTLLGSFLVDIGAATPPEDGALTVRIEPAKARGQQAGWRIGSDPEGAWRDSGDVIGGLPPASLVTVGFRDIPGWETPASALSTVSAGITNEVQGVYGVRYTQTNAVPLWWLVDHGITNNFEEAARSVGANRMRRYESYIAGLDPDDPASVFRIAIGEPSGESRQWTMTWAAVSGRTYSVCWSPEPNQQGSPLPGGENIQWPASNFTYTVDGNPRGFLRLRVRAQTPE